MRRLYNQFQPSHYDVALTIDPAAMTFRGTVTITGKKTGRPSQRITLHQKGLSITSAHISKFDKKGVQSVVNISRINTHKSYDEVRIHTSDMLYPGSYTLTVIFEGNITRNMEGIYPCFYRHGGKEQKLIATQFESHHAREAFPCIDEPEAKATFTLTLTAPKTKAVLSNTPTARVVTGKSTDGAGLQTTTFETTPRMSTYLLAFAIGDMDYLEATTKDGVLVRTYATPDNVAHTKFALEVAVKSLEFYNQYFDIAYPLPKCDLIALPDFASGAMENWGCITFREQALLVDPKNTSLPMKQWVANVVAHELTHQWFGNLVTMKWWNDLWLNESFASWMSYLAIDELFPEWNIWEDFIVSEQSQALKLDALEHTHPIEVSIKHPDEIRTIFDAISYEKGASVILMLKKYLGNQAFRNGLRLYLKKHAYGNTESTDLWAAWQEASGKPVREFMGTWTSQPGYPIVYAGEYEGKTRLLQERFYLNPSADKRAALWPVPLLPSAPLETETLQTGSLDVTELPQQLLLNHGRTGFYRVTYDEHHASELAQQVRAGNLEPLDRLGLLADTFDAAKAGYVPTVTALLLLAAYEHESNNFVWDVIAGSFGAVRITMRDEALRDAMKPLGRKLAAEQVARLGWDESSQETHFDTLLRPTVLGMAAVSDEESVVTEALRRFRAMKTPEDVAPNIRSIVYSTAARKGGKKEFDKMLALHNQSTNSEDRVALSAALTGFEQPELIQRALGQITSENVRLQDAAYWVAYSFANRFARDVTWEWMTSHWDWLQQNLGSDLSFYRMPNYAARNYSEESFLPTFQKFFQSHMSAAFDRPVKQGVETIQWQSAWRSRDLAAIKQFFAT